jgi:hypothetical protein
MQLIKQPDAVCASVTKNETGLFCNYTATLATAWRVGFPFGRKFMFQSLFVSRRIVFSAVLVGLFCGAPALEAAPRKPLKKASRAKVVAFPALVTIKDPVEGAFTVSVPKGWRSQAFLTRTYDIWRAVVNSMSPDGNTLFFFGDPHLPGYIIPTLQFPENNPFANLNPLMRFSNYVPAQSFFPGYVKHKFGRLPGFRITGVAPDPQTLREMQQMAQRRGMNAQMEAVLVKFNYRDGKKPMNAILSGSTILLGTTWTVNVGGITTTGDPMRYLNYFRQVGRTMKNDPNWLNLQNQKHNQRMAQLQQDSQNNMASMSASNRAHEMRMKNIQDAGNASMKNWYEKQATSDATHRSFLNTINNEHTVVTGGKAFQVNNSHQNYFINKNDQTYVGTQSGTTVDDLRRMGLDPNDYVQAKIKR